MSDYDENLSDVSQDEEDEELIWRVFYAPLEEKSRSASIDPSSDSDESSEDETDLSDIDDAELVEKYKQLKKMKVDEDLSEEQERRLLLSNFTGDQMDKYEAYRRARINKGGVKKVCHSVLGHSVSQNISIVLAGLGKLLLSEIITRAFEVQEREFKAKLILDIDERKKEKRRILKSLEEGKEVEVDHKPLKYEGDEKHSLQPEHIREAWRLYKLENSATIEAPWKTQGDSEGTLFR